MSTRVSHRATVLLTLVPLAAGAGCAGGEGAPSFHSIGTGGTGGIYYPLGGAVASHLSAADSGRRFTAEVTGGSVENLNRVAAGQVDLGFTLAGSAYEAYHAGVDGGEPLEALRVVAPLYPNVIHVLVRSEANLGGVEELAGRKVSVGSPGSGTEQSARQILGAHGLDYDQLDARFLTFRESAAALRDRALDAAILSVGFPAAAVLEATTGGAVELLAVDGAGRDTLLARFPYYRPGTIPSGVYQGVDRPVATVAMNNWVVGRADLESEIVEALLRILRDEREALARVHDMAGQIDLAALAAAPIPLHSAAEAFVPEG